MSFSKPQNAGGLGQAAGAQLSSWVSVSPSADGTHLVAVGALIISETKKKPGAFNLDCSFKEHRRVGGGRRGFDALGDFRNSVERRSCLWLTRCADRRKIGGCTICQR